MAVTIGIDGGATRATAVVADDDGRVLARVEGGAGLVRAAEPAAGAGALAALAARALEAAGAEPPAAALCCALAGAGRDAEREAVRRALAASGVAGRVLVVTDAEAALHDAFGARPGLLLIAGTGSIAWGRNARGEIARVGGWGVPLGDEGSGYALGLAALRAVARAADGRGPPTALTGAVLRHAGADSAEALIPWAQAATKAAVAALAPAVADAAESSDDVAAAILAEAAADLADHVPPLYRRLAPWPDAPRLALTGGLLDSGGPLREPILAELRRRGLELPLVDRPVDAARGAAALARRAVAALD